MSRTYHFIGIGGIGMSGLARILLSKQIKVCGSDIASNYVIKGLIEEGAIIHQGHSEEHIQPDMTVVYNSDIKEANPEYLAAIKMQCALLHRADLLAQLIEGHRSLAIAGTHGKTTTSALLATVLVAAGFDPSFAVGGMLLDFHANSRLGQGEYFAFEADESDRSFLKYFPYGAIITNIDQDHLCNYEGSEELLIQSFKTFMSQVTSSQHVFWCGDDPHLQRLNYSGKRYGFSEGCDWKASSFRQQGFHILFDIEADGKIYRDVEVALTGKHNALNALAVFGLARTLGIAESVIREAFKTFKGVMRRCEKKGEVNGVLFLDDYAHHPTEIDVTLKAIREAIQERRLVVVFQPHRYSRTQDCLGLYGSIFEMADEVFITEIYAAGETPIPGLSHEQIISEIRQGSSVPVQAVSREEISQKLAHSVQPHDVVVTLGAGDITQVGAATIQLLEKHTPRRLKVGLIFGGSLTEHEVSIRSARHFRDSLHSRYYEIEEFGITKSGTWIVGPDVEWQLNQLLEGKKSDSGRLPLSVEVLQKLQDCDVCIPVLHGPYGEDGTIQGFFEILKKAYVGCDHRSAAICMDKLACKKLALQEGIQTSPFIDFSIYEWQKQPEAIKENICRQLRFPVFVKPTHLGSTVGIKKVANYVELEQAIAYAFHYDTHVLVENGIAGREIEFAVLGNDQIWVFPPGEIFTGGEMYSYQGKYAKNGMKTTPQADLPPYLIEKGRLLAGRAYQAMGCCGLARVDFFLEADGTYWFNEINPLPGFTATSLYPQMCAVNGLSGPELMDQLIILALQRRRRQNRVELKGA